MFTYYGLAASGREYVATVRHPAAEDLDRLFGENDCELVFYGHDQERSDKTGRGRYVYPGVPGRPWHAIVWQRWLVGGMNWFIEACVTMCHGQW